MKRRNLILFTAVAFAACVLVWWFRPIHGPRSTQEDVVNSVTNAGSGSHSNPEIYSGEAKANGSNRIVSDLMMSSYTQKVANAVGEMNFPINFYGRVVDQDSNSLGGVHVQASVRRWQASSTLELTATGSQISLTTKKGGQFEIIGESGDVLEITELKKDQYEMSPATVTLFNYERVRDGISSESAPVIFKMRKKGTTPQPLVNTHVSRAGIPCDGTSVFFDLETGKKSSKIQDLKVTFKREPQDLPPGDTKFDWIAVFEISNGGLIEATDDFLTLAPENGYKQTVRIAAKKSDPDWTQVLKKQFYFQSNGRFGRLNVKLTTNYQPPPTGLTMDVVMNPSGSRILE